MYDILDGVRVIELSLFAFGPSACAVLGDWGADVIKVGHPSFQDPMRGIPVGGLPRRDDDLSFTWEQLNRNKRSIALDFRNPDDVAVVHALFRRADIAIENFLPGTLKKFGLDYETAREINPALIYLSISGFGTAEGAKIPGYDLVVQAVSGLMSMTGDPDGEPYRAGIAVFDVMTGLHGAIGVLAALEQRRRTGEGQHVEVNLLSSALSGLVNHTAGYTAAGVVPFRMGNAHPSVYPYQLLPTKDREVIVACGNDRQWRAFCEVVGLPELADDERFRENAGRTANRDVLHPIVVAKLAEWSADDLFDKLNAAGVPCGPVNTIGEGVELAERLGLRPRVTVGDGDRAVDLVRNPITFSGADLSYEYPPPEIGEHSDEIRAWLAALTQEVGQ